MGTRHVAELFSAAYDQALSAAERRRYDEHLAGCVECAAAAEQFRQAIDLMHTLPAAPMPQRVVLPSTPPQPERRRWSLPIAVSLPRFRPTPAMGAAAMALVGVVAVVLVARGHGGTQSTTSGSAPALMQPQFNQGGIGSDSGRSALQGVGTCPLPLAVVTAPAGGPAAEPPGFANRVSVGNPQRPGQELVLATTASRYAPGSQVLVFAALTSTSGQHTVVVPCVTLHDQGATAYLPAGGQGAAPAQGGSAASAGKASTPTSATSGGTTGPGTPAPQANAAIGAPGRVLTPDQVQAFAPYSLLPPLAVAVPTAAAVANLPLQVIQIPANVTPGTVLHLVALVPAGLPGGSDRPAIEAVLTLEVS
jgi:hypothetical protein